MNKVSKGRHALLFPPPLSDSASKRVPFSSSRPSRQKGTNEYPVAGRSAWMYGYTIGFRIQTPKHIIWIQHIVWRGSSSLHPRGAFEAGCPRSIRRTVDLSRGSGGCIAFLSGSGTGARVGMIYKLGESLSVAGPMGLWPRARSKPWAQSCASYFLAFSLPASPSPFIIPLSCVGFCSLTVATREIAPKA